MTAPHDYDVMLRFGLYKTSRSDTVENPSLLSSPSESYPLSSLSAPF